MINNKKDKIIGNKDKYCITKQYIKLQQINDKKIIFQYLTNKSNNTRSYIKSKMFLTVFRSYGDFDVITRYCFTY